MSSNEDISGYTKLLMQSFAPFLATSSPSLTENGV